MLGVGPYLVSLALHPFAMTEATQEVTEALVIQRQGWIVVTDCEPDMKLEKSAED
jgi:hypothetical protein